MPLCLPLHSFRRYGLGDEDSESAAGPPHPCPGKTLTQTSCIQHSRWTCCWEVSWTWTLALCMCRRIPKDKSHFYLGRSFTYYDKPASTQSRDQRHANGFTGWSMETAELNFNPSYIPNIIEKEPSFMAAFGVFFTAVTGIVAGANLSGDLKDPSYSIPKVCLLTSTSIPFSFSREHFLLLREHTSPTCTSDYRLVLI